MGDHWDKMHLRVAFAEESARPLSSANVQIVSIGNTSSAVLPQRSIEAVAAPVKQPNRCQRLDRKARWNDDRCALQADDGGGISVTDVEVSTYMSLQRFPILSGRARAASS